MNPMRGAEVMGLVLLASIAAHAATSPDVARVSIQPEGIHLEFRWNSAPGFKEEEAVEFEVWLDPKCFSQPPGGKDVSLDVAATNIPDAYTDVWNYWVPSPSSAIGKEVAAKCEPLSNPQAWGLYFFADWGVKADGLGNFAVGTRSANALKAGVTYHYFYPTESAGPCTKFGKARITMQVFRDTCTLPFGDSAFTCPHLIGAGPCAEADEQHPVTMRWLQRICAPTDYFWFAPNPDVTHANGEALCVDEDGDGFIPPSYPRLYGTAVGDCDDGDASVTTDGYSPGTGQCPWYLCAPGGTACQLDTDCASSEYCNTHCNRCAACEAHDVSCADGLNSDCDLFLDAGDPDCAPKKICPADQNDFYCGLVELGQDTATLYLCSKGEYTPSKKCPYGCEQHPQGVPDTCAPAPCADECSPPGPSCLDATSLHTCENNDADSCLEWGGPIACPHGCAGSSCVACTPNASLGCSGGDVHAVDSCGNVDALVTACLSDEACVQSGQNAACISSNCAASCGGCCSGNMCLAGTADSACGVNGSPCAICDNATCENGVCSCAVETGETCFDGDVYAVDCTGAPSLQKKDCVSCTCSGASCIVVDGVDVGCLFDTLYYKNCLGEYTSPKESCPCGCSGDACAPCGAVEIIVDNDTPGFSLSLGPYWWKASSHDGWDTNGYDGTIRYTFGEGSSGGAYSGKWSSGVALNGPHVVSVHLPDPEPFDPNLEGVPDTWTKCADVTYEVAHGGTTEFVPASQAQGAGWIELGTFEFEGDVGVVRLTDKAFPKYCAVAFDAVRWSK